MQANPSKGRGGPPQTTHLCRVLYNTQRMVGKKTWQQTAKNQKIQSGVYSYAQKRV